MLSTTQLSLQAFRLVEDGNIKLNQQGAQFLRNVVGFPFRLERKLPKLFLCAVFNQRYPIIQISKCHAHIHFPQKKAKAWAQTTGWWRPGVGGRDGQERVNEGEKGAHVILSTMKIYFKQNFKGKRGWCIYSQCPANIISASVIVYFEKQMIIGWPCPGA